jgi:hypothetical protein
MDHSWVGDALVHHWREYRALQTSFATRAPRFFDFGDHESDKFDAPSNAARMPA